MAVAVFALQMCAQHNNLNVLHFFFYPYILLQQHITCVHTVCNNFYLTQHGSEYWKGILKAFSYLHCTQGRRQWANPMFNDWPCKTKSFSLFTHITSMLIVVTKALNVHKTWFNSFLLQRQCSPDDIKQFLFVWWIFTPFLHSTQSSWIQERINAALWKLFGCYWRMWLLLKLTPFSHSSIW